MKPMDIEKQSFAIIEKELTTDIFRWRYRESTDGNT